MASIHRIKRSTPGILRIRSRNVAVLGTSPYLSCDLVSGRNKIRWAQWHLEHRQLLALLFGGTNSLRPSGIAAIQPVISKSYLSCLILPVVGNPYLRQVKERG